MKEYIIQLFLQSGFSIQFSEDNIILFSTDPQTDKKSFWLLIERDEPDLLKTQSAIYSKFKGIVGQPEFDKNCSLLLLIKNISTPIDQHFKNNVLLIEDNPFYFKKYVLCYTEKEFNEFTTARNNRTELPFLERHMVSRSCFDVYKKNPQAETWQSLTFRIALKIPFINLKIEVKPGLTALFEENNVLLAAKRLDQVDSAIRSYFFDKTSEEIGRTAPLNLLKALNILNSQNGNQNSKSADTEL